MEDSPRSRLTVSDGVRRHHSSPGRGEVRWAFSGSSSSKTSVRKPSLDKSFFFPHEIRKHHSVSVDTGYRRQSFDLDLLFSFAVMSSTMPIRHFAQAVTRHQITMDSSWPRNSPPSFLRWEHLDIKGSFSLYCIPAPGSASPDRLLPFYRSVRPGAYPAIPFRQNQSSG